VGAHLQLRYYVVTLGDDIADYGLRVGDRALTPAGIYTRVVLVIGARKIVTRDPPFWHDHLWIWASRLIDRRRFGPQRRL
jgi:hypothetical protein